jgi:hypothetical protein
MARTKAYLAPLNVGEIAKTALSRVDIQRVQGAAAFQENVIALTEGAMRFRPGTVFTGNRTRNDLKPRLIPFSISSTETAMLEMTDQAMRVYVGDELVSRPAVATTWANPLFSGTLAPWVSVLDAGCATGIDPGGGALLLGTKLGRCRLTRTQAIASVGVEHAFRIVVARHPIRLRCGTTATNDDVVAQTTLLPGENSIAFTPAAATVYITIDALDVGTTLVKEFSLEGPGPMVLPTGISESNLAALRVDQSADVMFVASGVGIQKRIERRSMRSWSFTEYLADDGPFTSEKPSKISLRPSAATGDITVTASGPAFRTSSVNQMIEIYYGDQYTGEYLYREGHATPPIKVSGFGTQRQISFNFAGLSGSGTKITLTRATEKFGQYSNFSNGVNSYTTNTNVNFTDALDGRDLYYRLEILRGDYSTGSPLVSFSSASGAQRGIVRITGVVSDTVVNAEVLSPLSNAADTEDWRLGDWSSLRGWPSAVALHDGRLFWKRKDNYYGSVSDDYSSFDQTAIGDKAPILRRSGTGLVEGSLWLLSLQRLIDASASTIKSIRSSSFDAPLTPENFLSRDIDSRGSAQLSPVKLDSTAIYMSRDFQRAMEIVYNVDVNDYSVKNLTRLSRDIFKGVTVSGMAVQRHPDTRLWFICSDGKARILSYDKEEEVFAWQRWSTDGYLEDACPRPTDRGSIMNLCIRRTSGGVDARFIERVSLDADSSGGLLSIMSDCSVVYDGSPATVIPGGDHLEGRSVVVWADGEVIADSDAPLTVTGGSITLPSARSKVVYGLPYEGKWRGSKLAFGGRMGTAVSQRKQANAASLLLSDTAIGGIRIGSSFNEMGRLEDTIDGKAINTRRIVDEYDIDPQTFPTWASPDARVHLKFKAPYPATVCGIMLDVLTHES